MWWILGFIVLLIKLAVVLVFLLVFAANMVLVERKFLGRLQIRYGPNRVGPFGLLQPVADGLKLLLKEDIVPRGADRVIFLVAPAVVATVPLVIAAVVPFSSDLTIGETRIPMVITDLNIGVLFVLAITSLSVYGVALGGWASNSKYSLLGAIRGAAQLISYELALGLSLIPIVMLAGSFSLVDIVNAQARFPFIVVQPVSFLIFLAASMAESNRLPFDLPEAENELVAGFHAEYSGMRFALYFLGEYLSMIVLGALVAIFFLGGWRGPVLPPFIWFLIKMFIIPIFFIWTRGTLPRVRYDQLMQIGWKFLVPLALVNIIVTGAVALAVRS